jgi:hypothetical protein
MRYFLRVGRERFDRGARDRLGGVVPARPGWGQKYGPLKISCRHEDLHAFLARLSMNGRCFSYIAFWMSATERVSSLSGLLH